MLLIYNKNLRSSQILAVLIHSLLNVISPCLPECYLQSEMKIEPDLRVKKQVSMGIGLKIDQA